MHYGVIIVGAGVSGLCMAMTLRREGRDDFIVLEKGTDLGGTWRENDYPGCGSEVPVHTYAFSFAMNADWARRYGGQPEILNYLRSSARRFDVTSHIRFGTTVTAATFDAEQLRWVVTTEHGAQYSATALVLAVGILHQQAIPDIRGLHAFAGNIFHSSAWDHSCELAGKNVAIIGTGASAVQIIPEIAPHVAKLHVFQRTAPWVLPRRNSAYSRMSRAVMRRTSAGAAFYRWYLYWQSEVRILAFRRYKWLMRIAHFRALRHMRSQVLDPGLRSLLTPDYTVGCKQLLLSEKYYPALVRSNVEVATRPITEIGSNSVTTDDGVTRPVQVIILATGFVPFGSLDRIQVTGRDGLSLKDVWEGGREAFQGICVAGFPNLFLMVGPNSGLSYTSMIFIIEDQAHYIKQVLRRLNNGTPVLDVDREVQRKFNERLQRQQSQTVWSLGRCQNWYLDTAGINRVLWPNSTISYWLRTRKIARKDFTNKL